MNETRRQNRGVISGCFPIVIAVAGLAGVLWLGFTLNHNYRLNACVAIPAPVYPNAELVSDERFPLSDPMGERYYFIKEYESPDDVDDVRAWYYREMARLRREARETTGTIDGVWPGDWSAVRQEDNTGTLITLAVECP